MVANLTKILSCYPLRSTPITGASSLLRSNPPSCKTSIFGLTGVYPVCAFLYNIITRLPLFHKQACIELILLNDACHAVSKQVSSALILRHKQTDKFWQRVRFLGTSSEVYFRSSFLYLPNPSNRTFSPTVQYLMVTQSAPWGSLLALPVQRQRRAFLHLIYSIKTTI